MTEFSGVPAYTPQQLSAQGVNDAHAIINRMMGYVPDLHKIWVGTSDDQLIALSNEFPGFYRYALIMEEASEAERNKASRPMTAWPIFRTPQATGGPIADNGGDT